MWLRGEQLDGDATHLSGKCNNENQANNRGKNRDEFVRKHIKRDEWQMIALLLVAQKHLHFDVAQEQNEVKMTISRSLSTVVRFFLTASDRSRWSNLAV